MSKPFAPPDTPARWIRPRGFRIPHVDLAVRIDLAAERIAGEVVHRVEFIPHAPRTTLILDQVDLAIAAVDIDGVPARFSCSGEELSIALPAACPASIRVRVRFSVDHPRKGMFFVEPDVAANRRAMCWTQGAMEDHRHWFPAFDDPNNLSTYRIAITHRDEFTALANGDRVSRAAAEPGWATTTYAQERPHVLYLVNVAVGDFASVEAEPAQVGDRRIPIAHHVPRGQEACVQPVFRSTAFAIAWLSRYTGVDYAWSRYGHVVAHRFMWGGMENTTLTTITDRVLMDPATQQTEDVDADYLIIHELVHQWYGDLLTMKAWSDIWLNESFATWLEARGLAAWRATTFGEREADALDLHLWDNRSAYLDEDSSRYRRPLVTNRYADAYELFDRVAYEKGSLVLHHLSFLLGEERLRAALALYTSRHAHDLVETDDLRQAIEDATGEPLDWFFQQWLRRGGHPRLTVKAKHDAGRQQLVVEISQETVGEAGAEPWRLPCAIAWRVGETVERRAVDLRKPSETLVFACATAPAWTCLDPDGQLLAEWNEGEDAVTLLARAGDAAVSAQARARAIESLAKLHPTAAIVDGLAALIRDASVAELVRRESIAALGALRGEAAVQALLAVWSAVAEPRLRRALAKALGRFRRHTGSTTPGELADRLLALGDADASRLVAGECYAARGALEHPGAAPALRARMGKPSWNQRLRASCVRGLGDSGEAAAIDDVLPLLADRQEHDGVRQAACAAAAALGSRHLAARDRVRRAIEPLLDDAAMAVRAAAARALASLGDPAARGAIATRQEREIFGNIKRVLREADESLGKAAAAVTATAELQRKLDDVERKNGELEKRLAALEKRLG